MSQADLAIKAALILGGVALAVYVTRKASGAGADAAGQAIQAVNPWNQENVIYQTANKAVETLTGSKHDTWGTWLFAKLNPEKDDINSSYYNPPKPIDPYDVHLYRYKPTGVTDTTPGGALQNADGMNFSYF